MCARRSISSIAPTSFTKARFSWKARPRTLWATRTFVESISASVSRCRRAPGGVMALTQRLELKQGQTLVMTPQLQQAIKLLQLSNLELAEYVENELERNPLLERDESNAGDVEPASSDAESAPAEGPASLEETLSRDDFGTANDLDAGHDDLYTDE